MSDINKGLRFHKNGDLINARLCYESVLMNDSSNFDALQLLACLEHFEKNFDEAIKLFERAISISDNSADLYNNYGNVHFELKNWELAKNYYEKSTSLNSTNEMAYNNLGTVLKELSEFDEALVCFNKALEIRWNYGDAHWNRAILNLLMGKFNEGLIEFEWRWSSPYVSTAAGLRSYNRPIFNGRQPVEKKIILVYHEQGLGDTIQFVRFVLLLENTGAVVKLHIPAPLITVLSRLSSKIKVFDLQDSPGDYDYVCPMMSLPIVLGIASIDQIPFNDGYIKADAERLKKFNRIIEKEKSQFAVGFVWRGNRMHSNDKYRSVTLDFFIKLRHFFPNISFYALQMDVTPEEIELCGGNNIKSIGQYFTDFDDTLAACTLVDHLICVDTSVLHVAAAGGLAPSLLLPKVPDWRWMLFRNSTPWYSKVELLRCQEINDWNFVFETLRRKLSKFETNYAAN